MAPIKPPSDILVALRASSHSVVHGCPGVPRSIVSIQTHDGDIHTHIIYFLSNINF